MSKARNLSLLSAVEAGATTDQTKADLNAIGVSGGRKNLIINGGMTVSQRGDFTASAAAANGSFYVDRFKAVLSAVAGDKQHTTVTIGGVTKRAFKITATSAATGTVQIKQGVELSGIEVGETYTISCWMKSNHADARLRNNNIGGTSSDSPTSHTGGGAWEKITWTVDSTSTTADILVYATIYDGANVAIAVGDYIEITDLQMEKGSVATDFEHRSFGEELALCQRYYQFIPQYAEWISGTTYSTNRVLSAIAYQGNMRVLPTASVPAVTFYNNSAAPTSSSVGVVVKEKYIRLDITVTAPIGRAGAVRVNDIITLNAEL